MLTLGPLAFATPWILGGLVVLPGLWWLLRLTPPAPRTVPFPALMLLRDLVAREETPAKAPFWLLALRLALVALMILGLAGPLWHPEAPLAGSGPLALVVDDGWAAAADWPSRREAASRLLARAEREGRPVLLVTTAPPVLAEGPLAAAEVRRRFEGLEPKPWPTDRGAALAALAALRGLAPAGDVHGIWLSDGLAGHDDMAFIDWFRRSGGGLELLAPTSPPLLLRPPAGGEAALTVPVERADTRSEGAATLRLLAGDGRLLARESGRFAAGGATAAVSFGLPTELRNQAERVSVEGEMGAGATLLLDERWRRRPVGLVAGGAAASQPLLSDLHYLEQAMAPFAEVRKGALADLVAGEQAVLVLADRPLADDASSRALAAWVERGGMLLRFAGPRLAERGDALLPVRLRPGGRTLGGSLTWEKPAALAPFPADGPFAGLTPPPEVTVSRQVLADPGPETASHSLATLADGTPLITAARRGQGLIVLVHTTAGPDWSNLALSGLYIDMLRRLIGLSVGLAGEGGTGALMPLQSLDGFGRLGPPPPGTAPIPVAGFRDAVTGPGRPPGFYGSAEARRALNLGAGLTAFRLLEPPPGVERRGYGADDDETPLAPGLLLAALLLLLADTVASLRLRGFAGLLLAVLLLPAAARATESGDTAAAAARPWLACVSEGDAAADADCRAGLAGLAEVLVRRTAVDVGGVAVVAPGRDELAVFPLLYWPVPAGAVPLTDLARQRVAAYLRQGGMILFDGQDAAALAAVTAGLELPALTPLPADHVLTRSFYLLSDFPGRAGGGELWVAASTLPDGVSPVLAGGNDWAGAWAVDERGQPLHGMPGGERQREMAFRFGVNLVLYALTGTYKADQVHVPAILERLGR